MKLIFAIIVVLLSLVDPIFAIEVVKPGNIDFPAVTEGSPESAVAAIIRFFILLAWILAVMAITWWGIWFVLATGDDEKMKKSRKTIIYAFVGIVVTWLAYSIVDVITRANLN
jgi:hypothetical protein